MKRINRILTLILAVVMLTSIVPSAVWAQKGPYTNRNLGLSYIIISQPNGEKAYTLFNTNMYTDKTKPDKLKGAKYDKKTNTLTLTDCKKPTSVITAVNMGEDFKICVKGTNQFRNIDCSANDENGACIKIKGAGTLILNKDKKYIDDSVIRLQCKKGNNKLVVDPTVTLIAYTKSKKHMSVMVLESALAKGKLIVSSAANKVATDNYYTAQTIEDFWIPDDFEKDEYNNKVVYYYGKRNSDGKKVVCQEREWQGEKTYYVIPEYIEDTQFGIIANNRKNVDFYASQKATSVKYTIDFSKSYDGYRTDWGASSSLYVKDGKKYFRYMTNARCRVYEISNKKIFGRYTGKLAAEFKGENAEDEFFAAGYKEKSGNNPLRTSYTKGNFICRGKLDQVNGVTLSSKKDSLAVKFSAVKYAGNYEIRYSTNKNMTKAKVVKVNKNSATIKKLVSNKKYYVQVRAVKDTLKGKWSATKAVKTK